jgi:hypothetical protein
MTHPYAVPQRQFRAAYRRGPWSASAGNSVALASCRGQPVTVIDPAIESHYGTGYERGRLSRAASRSWRPGEFTVGGR